MSKDKWQEKIQNIEEGFIPYLPKEEGYEKTVLEAVNYSINAGARQYTYLLANLEPYIVNTDGEIGGQVDLYYTYRSKSNRHRYWNFHANLSTFYTLRSEQSESGERELMWRDINIDVERQWNKKLKTSLSLYARG